MLGGFRLNRFKKNWHIGAGKRAKIVHKNSYRKPLVTELGPDFAGVFGTAGGPAHKIYKTTERRD